MKYIVSPIALLFVPVGAAAEVTITEIMYDLSGTDTGREWVEVSNGTSESVDLSAWKFFESGTNHGLTAVSGDGIVPPGSFAVIVDDAQKFLVDWPGFSGVLFDSSFSLSNTGEALILRDAALTDRDLVSYESSLGGAGDGTSLQKSGGAWLAALPTPGAPNAAQGSAPPPPPSSSSGPVPGGFSTPDSEESGARSDSNTQNITARAGEDRTVIVGADSVFSGEAYGLTGSPLSNARFVWNFGDGTTLEGKKVLHRFFYPGSYIVLLSISAGHFAATDKITVTAVPNELSISHVGPDSIQLFNASAVEVDLSFWQLKVGDAVFMFPAGTFIAGEHSVSFPVSVTTLSPRSGDTVYLLYPNGVPAATITNPSIPLSSSPPKVEPPPRASSVEPVQTFETEVGAAAALNEIAVVGTHNLTASAVDTESVSMYQWFLALFGLIVVSSAGAILLRRHGKEKSKSGFEITEIS